MKVREEIDALVTMGLNQVWFLVVPRVLAAVSMTPIFECVRESVRVDWRGTGDGVAGVSADHLH